MFSPDLPNEELTTAYWMYNSATKVADKNADITGHPFSGRVALNLVNYSLTISGLYTNDSGNFTFISATDDGQQSTTQCISLLVQDVLTQPLKLSVINITSVSNASCEAWLQCSTTQDRDVSYNWTVGDKTYSGSTLQYQIRPQDRDTTFKCTVANMVSDISATRVVNCRTTDKPVHIVILVAAAGGGLVLIVIIVGIVVFCRRKRARAASDAEDLTVYADIDDITRTQTLKPCSVYETLDDRVPTVRSETHTIYDKIQFNRMTPGSTQLS